MNGEKEDNDLNYWFSTYGLITAERILGKYKIKLNQDQIIATIKAPVSFYHRLLKIPLKNVLNGIILQQAKDYHVYAQKLFIDYLLSGENGKDQDSQGASTREALEKERQKLVILGEDYSTLNAEHQQTIATSQAYLIKMSRELLATIETVINSLLSLLKNIGFSADKESIRQSIMHALIYCDLSGAHNTQDSFIEKMNERLKLPLDDSSKNKVADHITEIINKIDQFNDQSTILLTNAQQMKEKANSFRTQFYDKILRVMELIKLLSEYKIDIEQDEINREALYFDKSIGEL